ncbi:MAG: hypothetical protein ACJ0GF_01490 [Burkholderiales bacterium]|tara:strand:- start:200 stop:388 length:189 start_codon:yes stop_codon:yes gene_type:complete
MMKYLIPVIAVMLLAACNETSVSQNIDKGKHVTPPNLFLKETNMTLDLEQECEQKPAITASQ